MDYRQACEVLELPVGEGVDQELAKKAFRKAALGCHPDRYPGDSVAEERYKQVSEAYTTLTHDPAEVTKSYDALVQGERLRGGLAARLKKIDEERPVGEVRATTPKVTARSLTESEKLFETSHKNTVRLEEILGRIDHLEFERRVNLGILKRFAQEGYPKSRDLEVDLANGAFDRSSTEVSGLIPPLAMELLFRPSKNYSRLEQGAIILAAELFFYKDVSIEKETVSKVAEIFSKPEKITIERMVLVELLTRETLKEYELANKEDGGKTFVNRYVDLVEKLYPLIASAFEEYPLEEESVRSFWTLSCRARELHPYSGLMAQQIIIPNIIIAALAHNHSDLPYLAESLHYLKENQGNIYTSASLMDLERKGIEKKVKLYFESLDRIRKEHDYSNEDVLSLLKIVYNLRHRENIKMSLPRFSDVFRFQESLAEVLPKEHLPLAYRMMEAISVGSSGYKGIGLDKIEKEWKSAFSETLPFYVSLEDRESYLFGRAMSNLDEARRGAFSLTISNAGYFGQKVVQNAQEVGLGEEGPAKVIDDLTTFIRGYLPSPHSPTHDHKYHTITLTGRQKKAYTLIRKWYDEKGKKSSPFIEREQIDEFLGIFFS